MNDMDTRRSRWRLILGETEGFSGIPDRTESERGIDRLLNAAYGPPERLPEARRGSGDRGGFRALEQLAELRGLFPPDAEAMVIGDVLRRGELKKLAGSPKTFEMLAQDARTASALLAMRHAIPARSRKAAEAYIRRVSEAVLERLGPGIRQAVAGALGRKERAASGPRAAADLKRTVENNIRYYNPESKTLIPERIFYLRKRRAARDVDVILALDQSASMSDSMLYASVTAAALCAIPALDVRVVAFDHRVADLGGACREDPVGALFGLQLGGSTDIARAAAYCAGLVRRPDRTLFILLTDLMDPDGREKLLETSEAMLSSGVRMLVLLALSDRGTPAHDEEAAGALAGLGALCASCPPEGLPGLLERALDGMRG